MGLGQDRVLKVMLPRIHSLQLGPTSYHLPIVNSAKKEIRVLMIQSLPQILISEHSCIGNHNSLCSAHASKTVSGTFMDLFILPCYIVRITLFYRFVWIKRKSILSYFIFVVLVIKNRALSMLGWCSSIELYFTENHFKMQLSKSI